MMKAGAAPTMKDVAREAGVSLGTVSKVINGIPVGESYRLRVEEATRKLGYQVNSYARGLKTNHTFSVALILPSIRPLFFAALADEITASLMRRGYRVLLMLTDYDPEAEQKCFNEVLQNKVDGIIALNYNPDLEIDPAIPFVTIDRHFNPSVPCVSSDNFGGGQLAAEQLMASGCSRLLFFRIGSTVHGETDKRGAGFEIACRLRGVSCHSIYLNDADTVEPFYVYLREHIHNGMPDYDGIFCNTDHLACRVLAYLRSLGIRVPEQVQIIGYDGLINPITEEYYCSTIVQPIDQMAEAAVQVLLSQDRSSLQALMALPVRFEAHGTTREPVNGE